MEWFFSHRYRLILNNSGAVLKLKNYRFYDIYAPFVRHLQVENDGILPPPLNNEEVKVSNNYFKE